MEPAALARRYMQIFFGGEPLDALEAILAPDLVFEGPMHSSASARAYIDALKADPPAECAYEPIATLEGEGAVNLVYMFRKPGVRTPMSQLFEVERGRITRILTIFDTGAFT